MKEIGAVFIPIPPGVLRFSIYHFFNGVGAFNMQPELVDRAHLLTVLQNETRMKREVTWIPDELGYLIVAIPRGWSPEAVLDSFDRACEMTLNVMERDFDNDDLPF